ncbi:MAG: SpoIIE family protein phosphatase [Flavobacteriales bacterium]
MFLRTWYGFNLVVALWLMPYFVWAGKTTTTPEEAEIDSLLRAYDNFPTLEEKLKLIRTVEKRAEKMGYAAGVMNAQNQYGVIYFMEGEYQRADNYFFKYYRFALKRNDTSAILQALNNRASIKPTMGFKEEALVLFQRATEFLNGRETVEFNTVWYNIALIYEELKSYKKSVSILRKIYNFTKAEESTRIKACNTLGIIYSNLQQYDSAFYFLRIGVRLNKKTNYTLDESELLNSMGTTWSKMKMSDSAVHYYKMALEVAIKGGHKNNELVYKLNIAEQWNIQGKYQLANQLLVGIRKDFNESEDRLSLVNYLSVLANSYYEVGKYKEAAEVFAEFVRAQAYLDSINNLTQGENFEYNVNKRLASIRDSLHSVKKQESDRITMVKQQETIKRSNERTTYVIIILLIFMIALVLAYRGFRAKSKVASQLKEQRDQIEIQKNIIEEKNTEVTDSINYARQLQRAILPGEKVFGKYFKDSALLYLPKDIVAGDFYFYEEIQYEKHIQIIFAVADCTGHGVPGALVSVVCSNALHRAVTEFKLVDPGKILDKVRELVLETFEKSGGEVKDGMDISLCSLKFEVRGSKADDNVKPQTTNLEHAAATLLWAGANNPLWIMNKSGLQEIKPDKQPIGRFFDARPFTTHSVSVEAGNILYLFSDGYCDQFGGEGGKKFKVSRLKEMVTANAQKPLKEQGRVLAENFNGWKDANEQTDDVCILVLKV